MQRCCAPYVPIDEMITIPYILALRLRRSALSRHPQLRFDGEARYLYAYGRKRRQSSAGIFLGTSQSGQMEESLVRHARSHESSTMSTVTTPEELITP